MLHCLNSSSNDKGGAGDIPSRWRILSGSNHWNGLLDPLDLDLRRYIIHYGEMAQATYDTFNAAQLASKFAGSSRYARANLFTRSGLVYANPFKYSVTKYFYATSSTLLPDSFLIKPWSREAWSKESNWIGYAAVATDEGKAALGRRDIVIAWRGTVQPLEFSNDLQFATVPAPDIFLGSNEPKVHLGFYSIYKSDDPKSIYNKLSARNQVLTEVRRLVDQYKNEEISLTITGHSLGAAVATLNAVDIVTNGYNKPTDMPDKECPVTAFCFSSPRLGEGNFKTYMSSLKNLYVLKVRNAMDIIPTQPTLGYADVGEELMIDTTKSTYLKSPGNVATWHELENILHGVAGTQGSAGGFKLEVKRDIGLVNKIMDSLKNDYCVPPVWWAEKHLGMVQLEDGSWALMDHEKDDF